MTLDATKAEAEAGGRGGAEGWTIYCDHNAAAPLRPEALAAMLPWLRDEFANPSSSHEPGSRARRALESARADVAALLHCAPAAVVFTSGGTEANHAALAGWLRATERGGRRLVVTTPIEHASVLATLADFDTIDVLRLPVDRSGCVDLRALEEALAKGPDLVTIGWANNEIGTVQPMAAISEFCRARRVPLHSDIVQALGKVEVDVGLVDLASVSAHKIGGPKGVGALVVGAGVAWRPVLRGGAQERERRAGTENVAGVAGFGAAARACERQWRSDAQHAATRRDELWRQLQGLDGVHRHAAGASETLPNTLNLRFDGVRGEALVASLDLDGIAVSSGSACAAGAAEPSHVLLAIGLDEEAAGDGVRFSFGAASEDDHPERIAVAVRQAVERMRAVHSRDRRAVA